MTKSYNQILEDISHAIDQAWFDIEHGHDYLSFDQLAARIRKLEDIEDSLVCGEVEPEHITI